MINTFFSFKGRLSRLEFLTRQIALLIATVVGVTAFALSMPYLPFPEGLSLTILMAISFVVAWAGLSLGARRLHDMNRTGWWQLLLIPVGAVQGILEQLGLAGAVLSTVIALSVAIYLLAYPGTKGPNRFGPSTGTQSSVAVARPR